MSSNQPCQKSTNFTFTLCCIAVYIKCSLNVHTFPPLPVPVWGVAGSSVRVPPAPPPRRVWSRSSSVPVGAVYRPCGYVTTRTTVETARTRFAPPPALQGSSVAPGAAACPRPCAATGTPTALTRRTKSSAPRPRPAPCAHQGSFSVRVGGACPPAGCAMDGWTAASPTTRTREVCVCVCVCVCVGNGVYVFVVSGPCKLNLIEL